MPAPDPQTAIASPEISVRAADRRVRAHDASHYLLVPQAVAEPRDADEVAALFVAARERGTTVTFRSGGTSLSGQGVSGGLLVDTRKHFRRTTVEDEGRTVRAEPGATVRQVNARLARSGRKLGPDPASEIACTVGGVVANNSSGMACGIVDNAYRTIESLSLVLPSGTRVDTADPRATELLAERDPGLLPGLGALRERVLASPDAIARIRQQFSMKNTMGYGVNALLDFEDPLAILEHLVIGSEGTLAFVAEARFRTVPVRPHAATALLVLPSLSTATAALPALVATGAATIELLDATSLRVAQRAPEAPRQIAELDIEAHTALLVEFQADSAENLSSALVAAEPVLADLTLTVPAAFTRDSAERSALWQVRKGLYTAVAGARPAGTTGLLEDIVVPVERLLPVCERLIALFAVHGYDDAVIFGHAKDGNLHFMISEDFEDPAQLARYARFTDDLVELVLAQGGSLKAEHGTGRIMAPFVRRQYGDELYGIMREIKALFDPDGILNPGVLLSDDPDSYLHHLKRTPSVHEAVDLCVECGYCEPGCPSRDLTLTPRQRIVLEREIAEAEAIGDRALSAELAADRRYRSEQSCAVDGMCAVACPLSINTGDLVRDLRARRAGPLANGLWDLAARAWAPATRAGGAALSVAAALPEALPRGATRVARAVLGSEAVPEYDGALPRGGARRPAPGGDPRSAAAVFFPACIGTMFGPEDGGIGATEALLRLAERAGVELVIPQGVDGLCCGTPWHSKGMEAGSERMSERVLGALRTAAPSLPIVSDASACSEGLRSLIAGAGDPAELRVIDSTQFAVRHLLPRLTVTRRLGRVAVHRTCSTTHLGANDDLDALVSAVADEAIVPVDWGCCAFAGDRGLLHPELTASATAREAAEVLAAEADWHVSANRTCEIGMTRATGAPYRHVLELLEFATRP